MNRSLRFFVFITLITAASLPLFPVPTPALAQGQGANVVVVNSGAVHVRSGPAANTSILGTVAGGTQMVTTGRSANGQWWRVNSPFGVGWISDAVVVFRGLIDAVPVVSEPAGTPETPTVVVDRFPATVYRNPNPDSFVVGIAPTSAVLTVTGRSPDGNWWQVNTGIGLGWVNIADVAFRGDEGLVSRIGDPGPSFNGPTVRVNTDTPVTSEPGGGSTLAVLPAGTALPAGGRTADNTWWQVIDTFGIGWIPVNNVSLAGSSANISVTSYLTVNGPAYSGAAFATATVESDRKIAYAKDSFDSDPMWDARLGDQLGVIARSPDGLWLQVTRTGYTGWMNFSGLTLHGNMAGLPTVNTNPPVANIVIVNTHRLQIRSGPGVEYAALTSVPGGTALNVTGVHPTLPWIRVEGDYGVGWVRIMYTIFRGNWSAVPKVSEPVGSLEIPLAYVAITRPVYVEPRRDSFSTTVEAGLYPIAGWTSDYLWALIQTPLGDAWMHVDDFALRGIANNAPVVR